MADFSIFANLSKIVEISSETLEVTGISFSGEASNQETLKSHNLLFNLTTEILKRYCFQIIKNILQLLQMDSSLYN